MFDTYNLGRRGTNTGTVATSATDATFAGPGGDNRIDKGCAIMPTSGGVAPEDEERYLSARPTSVGLMSVLPVFTTALANADTFEVLYRPLRFPDANNAINWALRNIFWEKLTLPITSVLDGDMLRTTAATPEWVATDGAGGSNDPVLSKVAATYPLGIRSLNVAAHASDAGDYALSANIPVEELKTYYLEATGFISPSAASSNPGLAADAGTLVLYDVTNGAAITLTEVDINRFEPEILQNTVTMPSGCEEVQIRLTCTAVDDNINWTNIIFRKDESKEFVVQDRDATVDRLGKLYATTSDVWGARGSTMHEVAHTLEKRTAGIWVYKTQQSLGGQSLWYEEWRRPAALTNDSTLTVGLDKEDVAAVATEHLLKTSGLRGKDDWSDVYEQAAIDAARVEAKLRTHERSYDFSPTSHVLAET